MALKEDLLVEVDGIVKSRWDTRNGQVVPSPEDVQLGNHAVTLEATVLYADLANSTNMVDDQPWHL